MNTNDSTRNNQSPSSGQPPANTPQRWRTLTLRQWFLLIVALFIPFVLVILLYRKKKQPLGSLTSLSTVQSSIFPPPQEYRQLLLFVSIFESIMVFLSYALGNYVSGNIIIASLVGLNAVGGWALSRLENVERVIRALNFINKYLGFEYNGTIPFQQIILTRLIMLLALLAIFLPAPHLVPSTGFRCIDTQVMMSRPTSEYIGLSDGCFPFDTARTGDGKFKTVFQQLFQQDKVKNAEQFWQKAHNEDMSDAEPPIYLENQRVLHSGLHYVSVIIGTILTGLHADVGQFELQGYYIAQKNYNDDQTHKTLVRLVIANTGSNAENATQVAKLIAQAVRTDFTIVAIAGWPFGNESLKVINELLVDKVNIPLVSAAPDDLAKYPDNFYGIAPSLASQAQSMAEYADKVLHAKKVAILFDNNENYSRDLADHFFTAFKGMKFQETYIVDNRTGTIQDSFNTALSKNPDAIFFAGRASDLNVWLTDPSAPATEPPILGGDALYEVGEYTNVPNALFSLLRFTSSSYPDEAEVFHYHQPVFLSEYQSTYDPYKQHSLRPYGYSRPDANALLAFDALNVILHAPENVNLSPENIERGLNNMIGDHAWQGVTGEIVFEGRHTFAHKVVVVLAVDHKGNIQMLPTQGLIPPQGCFMYGDCTFDNNNDATISI